VYGYQENDILEPLGDDKFLYECLESNKNLIKYDCFDEEVSGKEWVNKYRNDNRSLMANLQCISIINTNGLIFKSLILMNLLLNSRLKL
jgi:hypothetical protein